MQKVYVIYNKSKQNYTVRDVKSKRKVCEMDEVILINSSPFTKLKSKTLVATQGYLVEKFTRALTTELLKVDAGKVDVSHKLIYGIYHLPPAGFCLMDKEKILLIREEHPYHNDDVKKFETEG